MTASRLLNNTFSMPAGADLSSNQFCIVYDNGGSASLATDATNRPVGVTLNKPKAAGRATQIAANGCVVKCVAGAAIASVNNPIQATGAQGYGSIAASGTNTMFVGYNLTTASGSGALFELMVQPGRGVQ